MKNSIKRYITNLLIVTVVTGILGCLTLLGLSILYGKNKCSIDNFMIGMFAASFTIIYHVFYSLSYDSIEYEKSDLIDSALESIVNKWSNKSIINEDGTTIYHLKITKTICPSRMSVRYQDNICIIIAPMVVTCLMKRKIKR